PFNPMMFPQSPIKQLWHYVTEENQAAIKLYLERTFAEALRPARLWQPRVWVPWRRQRRIVMKDPCALLSAEWLADEYNMDVLVLIRHPAAFASSLKRLKWQFDLSRFAKQPALVDKHLAPFRKEIERCAENWPDQIGQAILLWRMLYWVVRQYQ